MGGGCQGCGMANATLKRGIETYIKNSFPEIKEVIDVTDHDSGANPYFSSKQEGVDPTSRIPHSLSYCTVHVRGSHCIERKTRGDQHEPPGCRSATIRYERSLNTTRQPYSANHDFDTGNWRVRCHLNDGVIPLVTRG